MDHDQQFLSFIHKNAAMGVSAIPQVLSLPQSRAMGQALNSQLQEYRTIAAQSQAYARKHGARLHTPGLAVRAMSGAMLKARTAADHTTSKLAQLMIQGSTMGTVEMTRRIHQYTGQGGPGAAGPGQPPAAHRGTEHPADEAVPLSSALARAQKAGGRWLGPPLPLVKNLPQRGPQRVLSSVEDRIKSKSIISRDMLLENDTSHDR